MLKSHVAVGPKDSEAPVYSFIDPIDGIVAPVDDGSVPIGVHAKFHGVVPSDDDTFKKDAEFFYGDGSLYHEKLAKQQEDLDFASTKFYGVASKAGVDKDAYNKMELTYSEAKKRAYGK